MRSRARILGAISSASAAAALAFAVVAPSANAVNIIEAQSENASAGWQAGTCNLATNLTCAPDAKDQFFTQAAGHPPVGFTQIIVKHGPPGETPVGDLKTVRVDLPVGLSVNPQATEKCQIANFKASTCPPGSKVGESNVTAVGSAAELFGVPVTLPAVPVYNIEPVVGEPARFGFILAGTEVVLEAGVAWNTDYHEFFTIHVSKIELPIGPLETLIQARILKNRLVFNGITGQGGPGGAFLTTPSTCFDPAVSPFQHVYSTFLHADSYQEPAPQFPAGSQEVEAPLPKGVKPTGCGNVPFQPTVATAPNATQTDSPFGPTVQVGVPFSSAANVANSNLRVARVSTPRGAGLNPAAATGLQACTDAQFGKGTTAPVVCPAKSEIGTVSIQTPVLPPNSLTGKVYLGNQLSRDPTSGQEYRIFIDAESPRYGQSVRLVGNVIANPQTGQLTAVVNEAPQLPFTSVSVQFSDAKGVLTSPPTCGPNLTSGRMTPWSGTPDAFPTDKGFTLTKAPGGGACAKTMASRPFAPGFDADPKSDQALAFTPFIAHLTRPQGQQELKGVDIHLPPGATAKLAGVPYCPPADIADAAARAGAAEKKNPSCPKDSHIGVATVQAGTGNTPLEIEGDVYLAGAYKGAPLSLAVITPAVAGPFDLGVVVVRVPLKVDPETAQINPDVEIPDVFGGAKLDIRSIFVNVNRKEFTLNGTNCAKHATAGNLLGGGADPTVPASFSAFKVSANYQLNGCKGLKFRPKLKLRLFGATHRNQHPRLRAALNARDGDANIARASVGLPHAIFLDQASLGTVCTRPQFAANDCPKRSIYGKARAFTPLLGKPLEGPVVLRSNPAHTLPDMVAHLEGQVDIDLVGVIDSFKGGIRTTFNTVPDVPVSKFVLTLPGGKHGLLVASTNLCKNPPRAIVRFKGQNGKKVNRKQKLRTPCGKKSKKHHGKKHGKA
ncbi:MAG TPA: hypothetical protein VGO24_00905 [Solirubrobacterales bacterium]|nr:hypothetical protein [Solirubrobacterales bacterium]